MTNNIDLISSQNNRGEVILGAATNLFCRCGYSGTRMSDIADAIGVTKPILYRYYKSKEELFEAWINKVLLERRDQVLDSISKSERSVEETTLILLDESIKSLRNPLILAPWRIAVMEAAGNPQVSDMVCGCFKDPILTAITKLFERGIKSGEIKEADPNMLTILFCAPVAAAAGMTAVFGTRNYTVEQITDVYHNHHAAFWDKWRT